MQLPVDVRKSPFREKYVDETFVLAPWQIFGHDPKDGTVFICDSDNDIFCGLNVEQAAKIIDARDKFLKVINEVLTK